MIDIQTFNRIAPEGLQLLDSEQYTLNESITPDGMLLRSNDLHSTQLNEELCVISRAGAGVNNIPVDECSEKGIVVMNTPGANANAVKELVIAGLLMSARPIYKGMKWMETLKGKNISEQVELEKKQFSGQEIAGKKLGVIGLGAVGALVANDAYNLKMDVTGYDPYVSVDTAWSMSSRVKKANSLQEALQDSDYVTVHVPVNTSTNGYVDFDFISQMKRGAVLLNFSRDEIVEKEDILRALEEGYLSGYVTDFATKDYIQHNKVLVFPHLGASTAEAEVNCSIMAVKNFKYFFETGNIVHSVNFPSIDMPLQDGIRITIINRNVPNMVGQMSASLAKHFVNIENIVNRSRGNFAYTIIDIPHIEKEIVSDIIKSLSQIEGVLKTRVILGK